MYKAKFKISFNTVSQEDLIKEPGNKFKAKEGEKFYLFTVQKLPVVRQIPVRIIKGDKLENLLPKIMKHIEEFLNKYD